MNTQADKSEGEKKDSSKSFRREFTLAAIKWYKRNGKNKAHIAKQLKVDRKVVKNWMKNEEKIKNSKVRTRKIKSGRKCE